MHQMRFKFLMDCACWIVIRLAASGLFNVPGLLNTPQHPTDFSQKSGKPGQGNAVRMIRVPISSTECSNFLKQKHPTRGWAINLVETGSELHFIRFQCLNGDPLYHYNMMIGKDSIFNLCFYMSRMQLRLGFNMSLSEGANCLPTKGDWALKWCFPKLLQNDFRFSKVFQQPNPRPSRRWEPFFYNGWGWG